MTVKDIVPQKLPKCQMPFVLQSVVVSANNENELPVAVAVGVDGENIVVIEQQPRTRSRELCGPASPVRFGAYPTIKTVLEFSVTVKTKDSNHLVPLGKQMLPIWPVLSITHLSYQSVTLTIGEFGKITVVFGIDDSEDGLPNIQRFSGNLHETSSPSLPTTKTLLDIISGIKSFPMLENVQGSYEFSWYASVLLYVYIERYPSNKQEWVDLHNTHDVENEKVDVHHLRYNAAEDLLTHIWTIIDFSKRFLDACREGTGIPTEAWGIMAKTLELVGECLTLLATVAHRYFRASYRSMEIGKDRHDTQFEANHWKLLRQRVYMCNILHSLNGAEAAEGPPPTFSTSLKEYISKRAQNELRDTPDWSWNSFTSAFCGVQGYIQNDFVQDLKQQLGRTREDEVIRRDRIRRLITHILQKSETTPECLRLSRGSIQVNTDVEHKMNQRINPTANDGSGSYANVYKGYLVSMSSAVAKPHLQPVALKCLRFPSTITTTSERVALKKETVLEIVNAWTLSHQHVLSAIGVSFDFGPLTLVAPWMSGGNTVQCLKGLRRSKEYEGHLHNLSHRWIGEIADGLQYVHQEGVVHGDIRGANILVDNAYHIKIADFGLSLFAEGHCGNYYSRRVSHPLWTAPEIIDPRDSTLRLRSTRESDVYAFAITCVELYTIDAPIIPPGYARPLRPTSPEPSCSNLLMPRELWNIVERCWHQNSSFRPSIAQVHSMLRGIAIGGYGACQPLTVKELEDLRISH